MAMEGELLYHTCFCRIGSTEYRNQIVSSNSLDPNIQIGEWQEHNHLILDAPIFSNGNSTPSVQICQFRFICVPSYLLPEIGISREKH